MTSISIPNTNVSPGVLAALAGTMAILILAAMIAFGALTAPVAPSQPYTDPTPLSGHQPDAP